MRGPLFAFWNHPVFNGFPAGDIPFCGARLEVWGRYSKAQPKSQSCHFRRGRRDFWVSRKHFPITLRNEQKGGSMTIFGKTNDERVEVPEIEVRGDEATIPNDDDVREQDRKVRLPKTKWF